MTENTNREFYLCQDEYGDLPEMVTVTVVTSSSSKIRPVELSLVADRAKEWFNLPLDALLKISCIQDKR